MKQIYCEVSALKENTVVSVWWIKKLRHRAVKPTAQSHTASRRSGIQIQQSGSGLVCILINLYPELTLNPGLDLCKSNTRKEYIKILV